MDLVSPSACRLQKGAYGSDSHSQEGFRSRTESSAWPTDDSQGSDTDLEDEGQKAHLSSGKPECRSRDIYSAACRRYNVQPSHQVLQSINSDVLDLTNRNFSAKDAAAVACMLLTNTTVTELNLSGNRIGTAGIRSICGMLDENVYITNLDVSHNNLGTAGAVELGAMMRSNEELWVLKMGGNKITEKDIHHIADALQHNYRLRELDLSNNKLQEEGGSIVGEALGSTDSLLKLDLSWNHLRLRGSLKIASGLQVNSSLTHIHLAWNGFADAGARAVAEMLKVNITLVDLDLTSNRISSIGAGSLAEALLVNGTLQILKLGLNPLSSVGAIKVLDAIKKNEQSAVSHLDLKEVSVTLNFKAMMQELQSTRDITITHGVVVRSDDLLGSLMLKTNDVGDSSPYHVLKVHMKHNKLLLWERLTAQDKSMTFTVDRNHFVKSLQAIRIPLTPAQIDQALEDVEKNSTGSVNYGELLDVKKDLVLRARQKSMMFKLRIKTKVNGRNLVLSASTAKNGAKSITPSIPPAPPRHPPRPALMAPS